MIERLVTEFLEMMTAEKGASPNTVDAYRRMWSNFLRYVRSKTWRQSAKKIFRAICGLCQMKKFMQPFSLPQDFDNTRVF